MLRHVLLGSTLVACLLLVLAEFGDLNHIHIVTVSRSGVRVGSHHGYALLILGVVAGVMGFGAWRGSRPAALAVAVLGLVALLIVVLVDLPDVDATGLYGRDYEQASASASAGFKLEAAGAILLLFTGVMTIVRPRLGAASTRSRRETAPEGDG